MAEAQARSGTLEPSVFIPEMPPRQSTSSLAGNTGHPSDSPGLTAGPGSLSPDPAGSLFAAPSPAPCLAGFPPLLCLPSPLFGPVGMDLNRRHLVVISLSLGLAELSVFVYDYGLLKML